MLEVKLLGQFEVRTDGALVVIPSRPAQSLLAYLALHPGPHPRERLAGLLWPATADGSACRNLRQALWHLRRALPAYVQADDLSISFHPQPDGSLDAALLETEDELTDPLSAAELIKSASAYRGELLPGFDHDWVEVERERLRHVFERRLTALLDQLVSAQCWPDVLHWSVCGLGG